LRRDAVSFGSKEFLIGSLDYGGVHGDGVDEIKPCNGV
jgi:hypothetical protein